MRIAIPMEVDEHEARVAATPETVTKLVKLGAKVVVARGAGILSGISDEEYRASGAELAEPEAVTREADIILKVRCPRRTERAAYPTGAFLLAIMDPFGHESELTEIARAGLTSFAMELMPRITRAQSMDVLSSQANLAGYRAVVDAAASYGRVLPMMMTPAGTIPAARVFIMGAGVAGLQAIATARRLGAIVTATDVRPAVKEQVASLGAKFVAVEDDEFRQAESTAGYAKPMSPEYQAKQANLIASHIAKQDIVVTTALVPGRPAPRLVDAAMVASMRPGSVLVDLAVERGGNVEGSVAGKSVQTDTGVHILGDISAAGRIAASASALYARNLFNFVETMIDKAGPTVRPDWDDELIRATLLTRDGSVVHPRFQSKTDF